MKAFQKKLAVITGAGTGMGRELARQLAAEGCHLAICDISMQNMEETRRLCQENSPDETHFSLHECDVSDEAQVVAFCEGVKQEHRTDHINLLFNNAGIGGTGSFLHGTRIEWEKTFNVCWFGVYYCTRAFMPLLLASTEGYLINTSSVNGFWASLGPGIAHTAYSSAKFAVKGFSEALISDLRLHAPHVKVAVVMPGHIGTSIVGNTMKALGKPVPEEMNSEDLLRVRKRMKSQGAPEASMTDEQIQADIAQRIESFSKLAPMTAAQAATIILDGVRNEEWRILVGNDAEVLDQKVRESPELAYESSFFEEFRGAGYFTNLTRR